MKQQWIDEQIERFDNFKNVKKEIIEQLKQAIKHLEMSNYSTFYRYTAGISSFLKKKTDNFEL
jgi:ACT domain-containing protein